jgi:hypothetical protein
MKGGYMRHGRRLAWAAPLIGAALLTTAACGSSSSSSSTKSTSTVSTTGSQATANAQLCSAVSQLNSAISGMKNLTTNTSLTQFATDTGNVATAWGALESAAKSAKGIDTTQLGNAVNTFESTMTSLPGKGLPFSQDIAAAKTAIQPVEQSAKNIAPNCSSTSTTGS